eukprot:6154529-Pyramimonas_sp.AAC.1
MQWTSRALFHRGAAADEAFANALLASVCPQNTYLEPVKQLTSSALPMWPLAVQRPAGFGRSGRGEHGGVATDSVTDNQRCARCIFGVRSEGHWSDSLSIAGQGRRRYP